MAGPLACGADPLYKIFVWDLEATGLNKRKDRIIQIAIYESDVTPRSATLTNRDVLNESLEKVDLVDELTSSLNITHLSNANSAAVTTLDVTPGRVKIGLEKGGENTRKNGNEISAPMESTVSRCLDLSAEGTEERGKTEAASCSNHSEFSAFFDSFVNPGVKITNSHIHNITNQMVRSSPPFPVVWEKVVVFVEDRTPPGCVPLLIAHNGISYDERLLVHELDRHDADAPANWRFADSLMLCRQVYPILVNANGRRSHSMDTVTRALGVTNQMAHNALGDVTALNEVLVHISRDIVANCNMTIHQWAASNAHVLPSVQSETATPPPREYATSTTGTTSTNTTPARRTKTQNSPVAIAAIATNSSEIARNRVSITDDGVALTPKGTNRKNGNGTTTPIRKAAAAPKTPVVPAAALVPNNEASDKEPMNVRDALGEKKSEIGDEKNDTVTLDGKDQSNSAKQVRGNAEKGAPANQNGAVGDTAQTIGQVSPNRPIIIHPQNVFVPTTTSTVENFAINGQSDFNQPMIAAPGAIVLEASVLVYGVGWVRRCQALARSTGLQCRLAAENGDACKHDSHIYQLYMAPTNTHVLNRPPAQQHNLTLT